MVSKIILLYLIIWHKRAGMGAQARASKVFLSSGTVGKYGPKAVIENDGGAVTSGNHEVASGGKRLLLMATRS